MNEPMFTFTEPANLPPDLVAFREAADSAISVACRARVRYLESMCRLACIQHLGCIPTPEEIEAHATQRISPDGARTFMWDGDVILSLPSPFPA